MYNGPVRGPNWPTASNFSYCLIATCAIPIRTGTWIFARAFALAELGKNPSSKGSLLGKRHHFYSLPVSPWVIRSAADTVETVGL